jgi:aldose 1-epimerase
VTEFRNKVQNYQKESFGKRIQAFVLGHSDFQVLLSNYGARIIGIMTPDRKGELADICAGYDHIDEYLRGSSYFGAICGRFANRIAHGTFELDGQIHRTNLNHRGHTLHGGKDGFHTKIWEVLSYNQEELILGLNSPDGDMGFPGNLSVRLSYRIEGSSQLRIQYSAQTDRPTVVNLATHSYFNLGRTADISQHILQVGADHITEVNGELIPTGKLLEINDGPLDFRIPRPIRLDSETGSIWRGYDHNFALRGGHPAAVLTDPISGRRLSIETSQPGLQLYTCNWGDKTESGKYGQTYRAHSFVCLEPQHFPDSPNHAHFPGTRLDPGQVYDHYCLYSFDTL